MCIKFYDDANNVGMIEIPDDKKIESVNIIIPSSNENGYIFFTDGSKQDFDGSDKRMISFNNGFYTISLKKVEEWLNWKPHGSVYSYRQQDDFTYPNDDEEG